MRFKLISLICIAWTSAFAFAGHPASDRVVDILDEGFRIVDYSGSAQSRALCSLIRKHVEHANIANRLLGSYLRSSDTAGIQAFRREITSFMVTKALPKLKDLKGKTGSYSVGQNPSQRSDGSFSVPVNIRTGSKSYNGRAIVSSNMKFQDVEYLGFSGVNYFGRDVRKELDGYARTSNTPVTAFVNNLRAQKDYVRCR